MATHIKDIKVGNKTYSISHSGETVYYKSGGMFASNTLIKGVKFKKNELINTSTGKKIASDYELSEKMEKN